MMIADAITPHTFFDYLQWGGIVFILVVAMLGFYKKWWVMGWQYKAVEESNIKWMELALRSANLVESLDNLRKDKPTGLL